MKKILRLLVDEDFMDEESDGIDVVERFGTIPRLKYIKEGEKGSWLGDEKDMDSK